MRYLFTLATLCIASASASPRFSRPEANGTVNANPPPIPSSNGSFDSLTTFPQQRAGESVGDFIDQLFDDQNQTAVAGTIATSKIKRSYSESYGLHTSTWTNTTDGKTTSYNISVDFSECGHGLKLTDDIGLYTFTDGTTANATVGELVKDVWSLKHTTDKNTPNMRYNNHICKNADAAMAEANQLLSEYLICKPTPSQDLQHNELRRLLDYNPYAYWTSVVGNFAVGAIAGGGIAAATDKMFKGNVSIENVVQTATVVGFAGIIGGIWAHCHNAGHLDNTGETVRVAGGALGSATSAVGGSIANLVPSGREAVVQTSFLGVARRSIARVFRRRAAEALVQTIQDGMVASGSGASGSGAADPAHVVPMTAAVVECLAEDVAAQVVAELENMAAPELEIVPMSTIDLAEANHSPQGDCIV